MIQNYKPYTSASKCILLKCFINFLSSINGETVYTHRGERSEEDIVEFVKKASG